jgi:hypothetical protein
MCGWLTGNKDDTTGIKGGWEKYMVVRAYNDTACGHIHPDDSGGIEYISKDTDKCRIVYYEFSDEKMVDHRVNCLGDTTYERVSYQYGTRNDTLWFFRDTADIADSIVYTIVNDKLVFCYPEQERHIYYKRYDGDLPPAWMSRY